MKAPWSALAIFLARLLSAAGQVQEEPPWWAAVESFHFPHIYATDLEDFLPQLKNATSDYVLIDFYAPWCPHCQHFAPDYERLALAIQRFDSAEAKDVRIKKKSSILSATVDCVRFAKTCDFWNVHSYPTLMWGRREDWIKKAELSTPPPPGVDQRDDDDDQDADQPPGDRKEATQDSSNISVIELFDGTAESIATWINGRTKFGLDISSISKKEVVKLLHQTQATSSKASAAAPVTPQPSAATAADIWDSELAVALLLRDILNHHAFDEVTEEAHGRSRKGRRRKVKPQAKNRNTTRTAFVDFIGLLAQRFPNTEGAGSSCRDSFAELQSQLRDNWAGMTQEVTTLGNMNDHRKLVMIDPDWLEGQWKFCENDLNRFKTGWHQCRGTWPGKRGFTCGLWNTFHMLAAQTTDETALSDLQTVRSAISHFFDCQECRDHFMQVPVPEGAIQTRRDAQLWWWNAHNVVNRRVGKLEEMYDDGDPGFVKVQWPTEADCPKCRKSLARPSRTLRLRGKPTLSTETVSARGTVSPAPSNPALLEEDEADNEVKPPPEVPVESVTLAEAVAREHWDVDQVAAFLDMRYGVSEESSMF